MKIYNTKQNTNSIVDNFILIMYRSDATVTIPIDIVARHNN